MSTQPDRDLHTLAQEALAIELRLKDLEREQQDALSLYRDAQVKGEVTAEREVNRVKKSVRLQRLEQQRDEEINRDFVAYRYNHRLDDQDLGQEFRQKWQTLGASREALRDGTIACLIEQASRKFHGVPPGSSTKSKGKRRSGGSSPDPARYQPPDYQ